MTLSRDKTAELRVKNLEMIQTIITRTAGYSAGLKTTAVTLVAAVMGIALTLKTSALLLAAFVPIVGLVYLDARYLKTERWFREHFREVADEDWTSPPTFRLELETKSEIGWWNAASSWSIWPFYSLLAALIGLVWFLWR
ncbi:hypothetical protein [Bosea sp. LjRoot237]|uniref:hypothetical protein n=1 Tax=Bosea sp. LjRoot237 TaxID=3342292 RepID=UPI003ED1004D